MKNVLLNLATIAFIGGCVALWFQKQEFDEALKGHAVVINNIGAYVAALQDRGTLPTFEELKAEADAKKAAKTKEVAKK